MILRLRFFTLNTCLWIYYCIVMNAVVITINIISDSVAIISDLGMLFKQSMCKTSEVITGI